VYAVFGEHVWLGRLVSLLFSIGTLVALYFLAKRLIPQRAAYWALGFAAICPLFIRYSVAFMPEAVLIFFYVVAMLFFAVWMDEQRTLLLMVAAVSLGFAVLVKATASNLLLFFFLVSVSKFGIRLVRETRVWVALGITLLPGVAWYLHARNLYLAYGNTFGLASGGDDKFGRLADRLDPGLYLSIASLDLSWVFAGASFLVCLAGIVAVWKTPTFRLLLYGFFTIGVYYVVVPRYPRESWGLQYHIFVIPFAALAIGLGMQWIADKLKGRTRFWVMTSVVVLSLLGSGIMYARMLGEEGYWLGDYLARCGTIVRNVVPPSQRIVVSSSSPSVMDGEVNNFEEPTVFFYAQRFGWSLPSDRHTARALDSLREEGAEYFVIPFETRLKDFPDLARYLASNAERLEEGRSEGCGIFRLHQSREVLPSGK
jgi:4-amino-4-deoxy-L-arabinose transferase-like glycosyltransferase